MLSMEQIKRDSNEFGGFQVERLPEGELAQRLCARRFCGAEGYLQLVIPFEIPKMYRIVCKRHFVMMMMISAAAMGDPSPVGEARRIAEAIGFDWALMGEIEPLNIMTPESFVCSKCGEKMLPETVGMYKGLRWIHTCGEPNRPRED